MNSLHQYKNYSYKKRYDAKEVSSLLYKFAMMWILSFNPSPLSAKDLTTEIEPWVNNR